VDITREGINSTKSRIRLLAGTFVALSLPGRFVTQELDEELSVLQALSENIPINTRIPEELIVFEYDLVHATNRLNQDIFCQGLFALGIGSVIATGGNVHDGQYPQRSQPLLERQW
jgi:hypothetical protein